MRYDRLPRKRVFRYWRLPSASMTTRRPAASRQTVRFRARMITFAERDVTVVPGAHRMRRIFYRGIFFCIGLVAWANPRALAEDKHPPASQDDFFEKSVRPVLSANCFKCH